MLGHHYESAIDGIDKWLVVFMSDCSVLVRWSIVGFLFLQPKVMVRAA